MNSIYLLITTIIASTYSLPALNNSNVAQSIDPSFLVVAPFNNIQDVTRQKIAQAINSKPFSIVDSFPDSGRKYAVKEQESFVSQLDTAYGRLQEFVATFFNPKPIVDTIQEQEKYGNDGGKVRLAGVAVIAGFEGVSNLVNAAIDAPNEVVRQLGKKLGVTGSAVGAKISGL